MCVVVASRNRPEMAARCLRSVRAALTAGDELVLVDSASADPLAYQAIATSYGAAHLRIEQPGVNRARNAGWRSTTADLVLFTDDDVEVEPGWADAFAEAAPADLLTGWVGTPEGQVGTVATTSGTRDLVFDAHSHQIPGHGASVAVRRSALERVGGWDEAMGVGGRFRAAPEHDLFDRVLGSGGTGRYVLTARAVHHQWRTDRQLALLHARYALGAGARMAKLRRTDRRRLRSVVREHYLDWGLLDLGRSLRTADLRAAVVAVIRLVCFTVGFLDAAGTPVVAGHFTTAGSTAGR